MNNKIGQIAPWSFYKQDLLQFPIQESKHHNTYDVSIKNQETLGIERNKKLRQIKVKEDKIKVKKEKQKEKEKEQQKKQQIQIETAKSEIQSEKMSEKDFATKVYRKNKFFQGYVKNLPEQMTISKDQIEEYHQKLIVLKAIRERIRTEVFQKNLQRNRCQKYANQYPVFANRQSLPYIRNRVAQQKLQPQLNNLKNNNIKFV